jgi:hypothetical protein
LHTEAIRTRNALTQQRNHHYHFKKWGGYPGQERFKTPFMNPDLTPYIAPEMKDNPYPGYGRTDRDIVTI